MEKCSSILGFGSKILGAGASDDVKVGTEEPLPKERPSIRGGQRRGCTPPLLHPTPKQAGERPLQKLGTHIARMMVIMKTLANIC